MSEKPMRKVRFATAREVITTHVEYVDGTATVAEAIRLMREKHVSSLLVNRRSREDAWGIVTRKDVVNKIVDPGKDPNEMKVFEIMSKPLVTVSPGLALKYCARLFNSTGIRRAPVFDGRQIIGILSNTDIFDAVDL